MILGSCRSVLHHADYSSPRRNIGDAFAATKAHMASFVGPRVDGDLIRYLSDTPGHLPDSAAGPPRARRRITARPVIQFELPLGAGVEVGI